MHSNIILHETLTCFLSFFVGLSTESKDQWIQIILRIWAEKWRCSQDSVLVWESYERELPDRWHVDWVYLLFGEQMTNHWWEQIKREPLFQSWNLSLVEAYNAYCWEIISTMTCCSFIGFCDYFFGLKY